MARILHIQNLKIMPREIGPRPNYLHIILRAAEPLLPVFLAYWFGRSDATDIYWFARSVFAELLALQGDAGARLLIERSPKRVSYVEVDAEMPPDVDTIEQLDALDEQADER